jgi:hypothetical protein
LFRRRTVLEDAPAGGYGEVAEYDRVEERAAVFDPHRVIALIAGLGFLLFGALVLLDTGLADFPSEPVTTVAGFTQTPLLGVIDLALGLLLLAGAADLDRSIGIFTGGLMVVGGILMAVDSERMPVSVRSNSGYGWLLVLVGAVVLFAALVLPTAASHRRVIRSDRAARGI